MRLLEQALQDHELTVLRVIGEWWELDLAGSDKAECVSALSGKLAGLDMREERRFLPPEDAAAVDDLVAQGGRIPVATFARDHGEVRLMGPGRLEREEPWLDPVSAAEALWYRGFLFRGFDETPEGVLEFYYLPQELLAKFPQAPAAAARVKSATQAPQPVAAPSGESQYLTDAVDDLTAILALTLHITLPSDEVDWSLYLLNPEPDRRSLLFTLAKEMGILQATDSGFRPTRAAVEWLKQSRASQLYTLADAWSNCSWNELRHTPGLACEGEGWHNDPILARTALLDALPRTSEWYRTRDLIAYVKQIDADFQRPDGNYDTWYVRETGSETYLTGFDTWDLVEGRLLQYLIEAPCRWMGLVETEGAGPGALYRLTPLALDWVANAPAGKDILDVPIVVQADGSLMVPFNADRYRRFQAARISEAEPVQVGEPFRYRLTPRSLALAQDQGITLERILHFLEEASERPVPASVRRAVDRWGDNGVEARVQRTTVLRVREAKILETLRNNPRTRDYLGESLGDLASVVRPGDWPKLVSAAAQLGLLLDVETLE